jgi:hypothetical protein
MRATWAKESGFFGFLRARSRTLLRCIGCAAPLCKGVEQVVDHFFRPRKQVSIAVECEVYGRMPGAHRHLFRVRARGDPQCDGRVPRSYGRRCPRSAAFVAGKGASVRHLLRARAAQSRGRRATAKAIASASWPSTKTAHCTSTSSSGRSSWTATLSIWLQRSTKCSEGSYSGRATLFPAKSWRG